MDIDLNEAKRLLEDDDRHCFHDFDDACKYVEFLKKREIDEEGGKYVRLDRFNKTDEFIKAWEDNAEIIQMIFSSNLVYKWPDNNFVMLGYDLTCYRVPADLIDENGMPKRREGLTILSYGVLNILSAVINNIEIFTISDGGMCRFCCGDTEMNTYNQWIADGMPVADQKPVEWRGNKYHIAKVGKQLVCDCGSDISWVFNFETAQPCANCKDENIKRYSNGTPILY